MSTHSTFLTEQINDYLVEHFSSEDDFLRELLRQAAEQKIPAISIAPEQTAFLQVLLRANGARRVLEIGSLAGYSAITMARALPKDGSLTALEIEPRFAEFIRSKVTEAGLEHIVTVITGPALESIQALPADPQFDVVFIDADKPNYSNYLDAVLPLVRVGGLVIGDNALAWGEIANPTTGFEPHNVHALQSFNDRMSSHPKLQSTLVPLGDGMVIGVKLAE